MRRSILTLTLLLPLVLGACKNGPNTGQLDTTARIFLNNGGAALSSTSEHSYRRPCLDGLFMNNILLGYGKASGNSGDLIAFIEKHALAKTTHERQPDGVDRVILTPAPPYEDNWQDGRLGLKNFCFGKVKLIKAQAVPDAKTITAGDSEPYIIQGTEALSTRITFKWTDFPGSEFVSELKRYPSLLARGVMQPADFDQEFTVVAVLPLKPQNFVPEMDQTE